MSKAKKVTGPLKLAFSAEQKAALKAAGFDWSKLLQLLQNPVVKQIILTLIDSFLTPNTPTPMYAPPAAGHGHCDHKEHCLAVLRSALCTAHCAAAHYEACCADGEPHHH